MGCGSTHAKVCDSVSEPKSPVGAGIKSRDTVSNVVITQSQFVIERTDNFHNIYTIQKKIGVGTSATREMWG